MTYCQYQHCYEQAEAEPTVIEAPGLGSLIIEFCSWHQYQFEVILPKWRQLIVLRTKLKSPHLPPPTTFPMTVWKKDPGAVFNLGKGEVVKESMLTEDDDDIPF